MKPRREIDQILMSAIEAGDLATAERALRSGADSNCLHGQPLFRAVALRQADLVRLLLSHGAEYLRCPEDPIFLAVDGEDVATIRALAQGGVDVSTFLTSAPAMAGPSRRLNERSGF